jgi:hypothetical protein
VDQCGIQSHTSLIVSFKTNLAALANPVSIPRSIRAHPSTSKIPLRRFSLSFKAICRLSPLVLLAAVLPLAAQQAMAGTTLAAVLPDAPHPTQSTQSSSTTAPQPIPSSAPHYAPRFARYIQPYQVTRPLSAKEKLELSVREQLRPYAFSTEILAAGWEHLRDGNPKYGSDSAGFGERLGAAAIQQTSNAIFSDGVFPALLRQDPRYYRKGSGKILDRSTGKPDTRIWSRRSRLDPSPASDLIRAA